MNGTDNILDAHVYLGQGKLLQQTTDELLRQMDDAGIAFAVACPVDHYLAVHNREGNDLVLRASREHPDRIAGLASVNPWFGDAAVSELRRALDEGCVALKLHPLYQGCHLTHPIVLPLLEVAATYGVPVYAHSGTAGIAEPFHAAELARRFPSVNVVMVHGGASDYYLDAVTAVEMTDNLWLETSRNGPANYCLFQSRGCTQRLVFGSSAPEYIPRLELETLRDVCTDAADLQAVCSQNLREVFKGSVLP